MNELNGEIDRGEWWIKSNKLANGITHGGESKDGWKTRGCRKRSIVQKDHHKQ